MKLIKSPDPWLEKVQPLFDFEKNDAVQLSIDMIELMHAEGGIGLSANQVGVEGQIFVMKPYLLEDNTPFAVINPKIESVTLNNEGGPEGCLSHPGLYLDVKRPKGIVVKFLDAEQKDVILELYDIDARCFLHEYDHLNGIEFTSRVSKLRLDRARKKLHKKLKRGN